MKVKNQLISFVDAINEAITIAMTVDENVICYGLGVTDPKGVFGTTIGLEKKFGTDRVFDMPTSENALTGIGIGAALYGLKPIMTHQRLDFALLSMDQIINNAAKWRFMFGNKRGVPLTIRMILGRGWGQGPTHSQNLQSLFAHIPGLKVVMPSLADDAKGLLLSSIFDPDPVIFIEHRWLHGLVGSIPIGDYRVPIGKGKIINKGDKITIVSMSYMTIEAIHAIEHMRKQNIQCELIDLRTIRPIDWVLLKKSLKKTGNLLVLDTGNLTGSISGEILAKLSSENWKDFKSAPQRLAMPDYPEATSFALTKNYHVRAYDIVKKVANILECQLEYKSLKNNNKFHDVPGDWFNGPF